MASEASQNLANHTRWDPLFHFFILPVLAINIFGWCFAFYRRPTIHMGWMVVVAIALLALAFKARLYALRVQTRVIRLEERLRLAILLAEPLRSRIGDLTESQLVALRFASDAEVAGLVAQTLDGKMSNREIKKRIVNWRGDYWRV